MLRPTPAHLTLCLVSLLLAGCASLTHPYRPSFVEMAREGIGSDGTGASFSATGGGGGKNYTAPGVSGSQAATRDLYKPLRFSDQLALSYADNVADILRGKFNRARIVREASSTTQVGLAALAGAAGPFKLRPDTLAGLGLGGVMIHELQGIFNAKGRAENYQEAVRLIEEAEVEYLSYNPSPSPDRMTQNGVSLVHRTNAAIHVVEQALAGLLPTLEQMKQATEPMSQRGATMHRAGDALANNISASGLTPDLPVRTKERKVTDDELFAAGADAERQRQERLRMQSLVGTTLKVVQDVNQKIYDKDHSKRIDYGKLMDESGVEPENVKLFERTRSGFSDFLKANSDKPDVLQAVQDAARKQLP